MPDHVSTDQLYEYLDGELSSSLHQQVAAHVAKCQLCSNRLHQVEQLFSTIESLPEEPLGRDLSPTIVAKIESKSRLSFDLPWWVVLEGIAAIGVLILWWLTLPKPESAINGLLDKFDIFMLWTRYVVPRANDIQLALQTIPNLLSNYSISVVPGDLWSPALALPWAPIVLVLTILWLLTNGLLLTRQDYSSYPLKGVHSRKGTNNG